MTDNNSTTTVCEPGFYGVDCNQPCPDNCLDTCNAIGFCDQCQPGYRDFRCDQECTPGRFGAACQEICSFHCELNCHHVTGECTCQAGWKPPLCTDPCDVTTFGRNCSEQCSEGCVDRDCETVNGKCQHGCGPGYLGEWCDEKCGPGLFGDNCSQSCSSKCMDTQCNYVTGVCVACPPGFMGDLCDTPCEPGTYGNGCLDKCSQHCAGADSECASTDGVCSNGCDTGFQGPHCKEECVNGKFGVNCTQDCSQFCQAPRAGDSTCNHVTGSCPQGCLDSHQGPACLTQVPVSSALVGGVVAGVAVAIILVVVLVVAFIVIRRRRSPKSMSPHTGEENGSGHVNSSYVNINHAYLHDDKGVYIEDEDEASDVGISMATESEADHDKQPYGPDVPSTRIANHDLATHLQKIRADPSALLQQFEKLPKGLISSSSVALNMANKGKNRYKNICAYDHSRVKLNIVDGDPNSDYINACYVDGYDGQPKFIASQGPNGVIVNDFLRMLWERRVTTVVMLTNPVEGGKHKCERYWPESGEKKFGSVAVTLLSTRHTAYYVIRTLQLAKEGRKIQVTQHHFTSWPDKGVPSSPWPLVDFHMLVRTHLASQPQEIPVVVHCSAGIGRTGTYIALDYLLREAAVSLDVDFSSCVWKLRQARVNMIQTVAQYHFLHEAVLVGLSVEGSLHKKDSVNDLVMDLNKPTAEGFSKLAAEYKRLAVCQAKVDEDDYSVGREDVNIAKNRYFNILPKDSHRAMITPSTPDDSDYINAVFLPGYRKDRQFIVTQMPLASTVLDVWKMVGEYPVSTVVVFPATPTTVGDTAPAFLPDDGQSCVYGGYKVTNRSRTQQEGFTEDFLYMIKAKRLSIRRNGRGIHVLRCEETHPGPDLILAMAQAAMFGLPEKQLDDSFVLVVCRTGAELSGVFVAIAHMIHRLTESPVSVPTLVGHLRTVRPQLVSSLEQYQTIYEALKLFATNSIIYTNMEFGPPPKPKRKSAIKSSTKASSAADDNDRKSKKKEKEKSTTFGGTGALNGSATSPSATFNGSSGGVALNGKASVNGSANGSSGDPKNGTDDKSSGSGGVSFNF